MVEALLLGLGVVLGAVIVYFAIVPKLQAKVAANEQAVLEKTTLETQLKEREKSHLDRIKAYEDAERTMEAKFDAISLRNLTAALEQHRRIAGEDTDQRKRAIEEMLKPFKERLQELDGHNREIEKTRAQAYGELLDQVKSLGEQQTGLTKETNRLVRALQDPGSAGSWGEMVLERVVEMAGLQEHYTFDQQSTSKEEDGDQRPDMIVNLPGGRTLVIDSKAPMRAYIEGLESNNEETRDTFFRTHAGKLYEHAKELKRRDYSKRDGAPDFTVMFIPSESAFRTAVELRPSLIEESMECNVVLATPTTLLALLRAVNYGWRQERLAQMAGEVQKDAARLYDALSTLTDHYVRLGKSLKGAGEAYNAFAGSLEGRVLPAARRFKDHGVPSNKEMAAIDLIDFHARPLQSEEISGKGALPFYEHDLEPSSESNSIE